MAKVLDKTQVILNTPSVIGLDDNSDSCLGYKLDFGLNAFDGSVYVKLSDETVVELQVKGSTNVIYDEGDPCCGIQPNIYTEDDEFTFKAVKAFDENDDEVPIPNLIDPNSEIEEAIHSLIWDMTQAIAI